MVSHLGYLKIYTYAQAQELSADDVLSGSKSENELKWELTKLVHPLSKNE